MLIAAARETKKPVRPDWFAPLLDDETSRAIEAWSDLVNDRSDTTGSTPFVVVDRWADRRGIEGQEFEFLIRGVRAADEALLGWIAEQKSES